jgi:ribonuclease R
MTDLLTKILHAVSAKSYTPIKPKALFKRMNLGEEQYSEFRKSVRELIRSGRLAMGRNNTLRAVDTRGTLTGVFRRTQAGHGRRLQA